MCFMFMYKTKGETIDNFSPKCLAKWIRFWYSKSTIQNQFMWVIWDLLIHDFITWKNKNKIIQPYLVFFFLIDVFYN